MENRNFIFFMALAFTGVLLWNAWQRDYHQPRAQEPDGISDEQQSTPTPPKLQQHEWDSLQEQPNLQSQSEAIRVRTDVLELLIDPVGGDISKILLLEYPVEIADPDNHVVLGGESFRVQGGLGSRDFGVSHQQLFTSSQQEYTISPQEQELIVRLHWQGAADSPLAVDKVYRLQRGSYLVQLDHEVVNRGSNAWVGQAYLQMRRRGTVDSSFLDPSYTGVVWSTPLDPYEKLDFEDLREQNIAATVNGGWIAWLQHYFIAAVIPGQTCPCSYYTRHIDNGTYIAGSWSSAQTIMPGEEAVLRHSLYVGPKEQKRLRQAAENLELTVDFGWFFFISNILFVVLVWLYGLVGNWGLAIILLTVIVKLVFFPLSAMSYRSMARIRELQPKMESLKQRHGDDRAAMQQGMMKLYREEKINPLGGCLPILVQIPVFIALYWVLLESVELRQANFVLWIVDLSSPDPYFVLPLLMGLSMYMQQKLGPQSPDPVQRKIISFMPIPFTLFTLFFPSGLVLYWVVSNAISILQQWIITKQLKKSLA